MSDPILTVEGVSKVFSKKLDLPARLVKRLGGHVDERAVRAVDDVSFSLARGEVVGLVGESGCGKSTLGRMAVGLLPPSAGKVLYNGVSLADARTKAERLKALGAQMIFQDPYASSIPASACGTSSARPPSSTASWPRKILTPGWPKPSRAAAWTPPTWTATPTSSRAASASASA